MLGTIGGHQQRLGTSVDRRIGIEQHLTDACARGGGAGLVREDRAQPLSEDASLGRLPRSFAALERDEHQTDARSSALARSDQKTTPLAMRMITPASHNVSRSPGTNR